MTTIHTNRTISTLYPNLDVITESTITKSVDDYLKLKTGISFGTGGRMFRHATAKISATEILPLTKALRAHEASLLELIGIFEVALSWANGRYQHAKKFGESSEPVVFNMVLAEESPVMVHGVHRGRNVEIQIYGEGLNNVRIPLDTRFYGRYSLFVSRMQEIINTFRNHLLDIENLDYTKVMEGVK